MDEKQVISDYLSGLGKKGGKLGGKRRLETMTAAERKAVARQAGKASGAARAAKKKEAERNAQ